MAFNIKFVITFIAFTALLVSLASNPTRVDACGIDSQTIETTNMEKLSDFLQWPIVNVIIGFALGFFGTNIIDYLRVRRKAKQFRRVAYNELKQVLAELSLYMLHPDSIIDEEKVQLWWDFMHNFDLPEVISPAENNERYEKIRNLEFTPARIADFVSLYNLQREHRRSQGKMMPTKKLNCTFISHNIETVSILNVRDISRLLNILRRIEALNSCVERIDFDYKKTFDSSISPSNHDDIVLNYYAECQLLSNGAKLIANEVADILAKW